MNPFVTFLLSITTGNPALRWLLTPIAGGLYYVFIIGSVVLSRKIDRLFRLPRLLPKPLGFLLGLPLAVFGAFFMAWSVTTFLKGRGTPVPFNPPPELITHGPYRYSRNPMIGGLLMLLFGIGLLLASPVIVLVAAPGLAALHYKEIKEVEEPELEARLGEDYATFRRRTPMFF